MAQDWFFPPVLKCGLNAEHSHTLNMSYPDAITPELVGSYPATAEAGGGYVWDAVLEYRVWCHPERGAEDTENGSDYYYVFATYEEALDCHESTVGSEKPLALVLQEEYIDEPENGRYVHMKERRIAEWAIEFLSRPGERRKRFLTSWRQTLRPTGWIS